MVIKMRRKSDNATRKTMLYFVHSTMNLLTDNKVQQPNLRSYWQGSHENV